MTSERTAIVLGAGIAGLAAAIALERAGYAVDIVEQAPAIEPIGAALSLWSNAMGALNAIGVGQAIVEEAAPIGTIAVYDRSGAAIMAPSAVSNAFLPTRAPLQRALLDALGPNVNVRLGTTFTAIDDHGPRVRVDLHDGNVLHAALAIDATGIRSTIADRTLGTKVRYMGYAGVLGISGPLDRDGDADAREYWDCGARFGLFDVGDRRAYWFHMRDRSTEAPALTKADCVRAAHGWPDEIARVIAATPADGLIPFAIHARTLPRHLGRGRIMCIGDAAHAMAPNLGQGGCQGLEDAAVLGSLAQALPAGEIVAAFERARLSRVRKMMRQSANAGRLVHGSGMIGTAARRVLASVPAALHARQIASAHRFEIRS